MKKTRTNAVTYMGFRILLPLLTLSVAVPWACAQTNAPFNKPLVGAIRWDGWSGPVGAVGEAELGPAKWHYRLPFFAKIISDSKVTIDGASQAVVDQEIAYAHNGGLDYWAFVTYDETLELSLPLKYYLSSSNKQDMRFCMITEAFRWSGNNKRWAIERVVPLMKEATYVKVLNGRPLFYLAYLSDEDITTQWGGIAGFRAAVDAFRSAAVIAGVGNPYIVIMDFDAGRAHNFAQSLGGDAISTYATEASRSAGTPSGAPYTSLAAVAESSWDRFSATGSQVVPIVMTGWDRRPRVENPAPWEPTQLPGVGIEYYYQAPTPAELADHLRKSMQWVASHAGVAEANTVIAYAWNENSEGGWLVPTISEGTARLDAVRGAVAAKPTALSLTSTGKQATGKLTDLNGNPVAGARVSVSLTPVSGSGYPTSYTLSGTVPPGTTSIDLGFRVNSTSCSCFGPADFSVSSFILTAGTSNPVKRDFSDQLTLWALGNTGGASASISTGALRVSAQSGQNVTLNLKTPIPYSGAGTYQLQVNATVAPRSAVGGNFAIFFLGAGGELTRGLIPIQSIDVPLSTVQSGIDGGFTVPIPAEIPSPAALQLKASYAGTVSFWPSSAISTLDPTPSIKSAVNAANYKVQAVTPGTYITIFGQNLGKSGQWTSAATLTVGGASVSICGLPASVAYNSGSLDINGVLNWQLNALVPDTPTAQSSCAMTVTVDGVTSSSANIAIGKNITELFTFTTAAGTQPVLSHADYSIVGPASDGLTPARPGETLLAWGTGDCTGPTIKAGGVTATVTFFGRVAPGLCQTNFVVPASLSGSTSLQVSSASQSYNFWVQ